MPIFFKVNKHVQQAKHKKSKAKLDRVEKKLNKQSVVIEMTEEQNVVKSEEEKANEKAERKKKNAHKNAYKTMITVSDKNGPRAYGK